MKITFPHLGNTYIAMKAMFDDLGVEIVIPPKITKRTLDIGTKISPEQICIPFKYNIGNYVEAIENGADTVVIVGGIGSCRFGYFTEITKEIFLDLGYNVDFIILEWDTSNKIELLRSIQKMMNTKNIFKIIKALHKNIQVLKYVNSLERLLLKIRPREIDQGRCDAIYSRVLNLIKSAHGSKNIIKIIQNGIKQLNNVPVERYADIIKIGLVGEIYILIDDAANLEIVKKLNSMGVEVEKSLNTSAWIENELFYKPFGRNKKKYLHEKAMDYIKHDVGGHGRETIGSIIDFAENGYDGVIHIMPFTCMPEIIAMSIAPQVQDAYGIPVMTLIVDEMTGEAGYMTRLEAFTDMIKRKRGKFPNVKCVLGS